MGQGGEKALETSWFNEELPGMKSLAVCVRMKTHSIWPLQIKNALLIYLPESPSNASTGSDEARD